MSELQNPITSPALAPIGLELAREMILEKDEEIRVLKERLEASYNCIDRLSRQITALDQLGTDILLGMEKGESCGKTQ